MPSPLPRRKFLWNHRLCRRRHWAVLTALLDYRQKIRNECVQTCVKTITVKFHCLKMHVIQLPLCSSRPTCKFHLVTFTTKFHYLQIQCPIAELRPIRQRPSFHPPKHLEWRPLCSKISDKMPHTANIAACNISFAVNRLYNTHSFLCAW